MCLLPATLRASESRVRECVSVARAGWLKGPGGRCLGGGNPAEPPGEEARGREGAWREKVRSGTGTHEPLQRPERAVRRGVRAGRQGHS